MTMKEGTGSNPFADDDTSESESVDETDGEAAPDRGDTTSNERQEEPSDTTMATTEIPYVIRRETVKEDRTNELVTFARDEYDALEDDVHADVADEMELSQKDVALTDVREGLIELASRHPDELAEILLEWGYEHRQ